LKGIGNISIKTILQHKSGLNKQGYGGYKSAVSSVPSLDEILVAKSKPGKVGVNSSSITLRYSDNKNRYSGAAFTVLQKLTEDITKANYARWMQNNVLNTMGMRQSSFTIEPEKRYKQENLSYAYGKNEIYRHPEFAAAGLYTNVNELANMIITINNSGRFKGRTVISNSSAFSISNGIGAKRSDGNIKASNNFYCHGGINKGYRAFFIGFRKMSGDSGINDSGIVLLTNVPKTKFRYDVVNAVIKAYGW
jgi:CubicO group peptidase (beta-lactamase class C family)